MATVDNLPRRQLEKMLIMTMIKYERLVRLVVLLNDDAMDLAGKSTHWQAQDTAEEMITAFERRKDATTGSSKAFDDLVAHWLSENCDTDA
jgi:hypothetical protein